MLAVPHTRVESKSLKDAQSLLVLSWQVTEKY